MKMTGNEFTFLRYFWDHHERGYIKTHSETNTPINYEIDDCKIRVGKYNAMVLIVEEDDLYRVMEVIADWTNNVFNCGCTFTIGW